MAVLTLVLLLMALVVILVFTQPVRISFILDTDRLDMHALARWTPVTALEARIVDSRLHVTVRLFGRKILARVIRRGARQGTAASMYKALAISGTTVNIACGLNAPHLTGYICAAAEAAGALVNSAGIEIEPDFFPDREYIRLRAATSLNIGRTLVNLIRASLFKRRKRYGSTA